MMITAEPQWAKHDLIAGRTIALKPTKPPNVESLPLAELLDQARHHNAAVLAKTYPQDTPIRQESKHSRAEQSLRKFFDGFPHPFPGEMEHGLGAWLENPGTSSDEEQSQAVDTPDQQISDVEKSKGVGLRLPKRVKTRKKGA